MVKFLKKLSRVIEIVVCFAKVFEVPVFLFLEVD